MFARWSPLIIGSIIEFIITLSVYISLLFIRILQLPESINLAHCSNQGLPQYNSSLIQCANSTAINFLHQPAFLTTVFLSIVFIITISAYFVTRWGYKKETPFIFLSGVLATFMLFTTMDNVYIAAFALLLGHSLGWALAMRQIKIKTSRKYSP